MPRRFLIVVVALLLFSLGLAGFEWWNGRYPTSLSSVFILIAVLAQRPPISKALGAVSKGVGWTCLVVAMALMTVDAFRIWGRDSPGVRIGDPDEAVVRAATGATGGFHSAVSEKRYAKSVASRKAARFGG